MRHLEERGYSSAPQHDHSQSTQTESIGFGGIRVVVSRKDEGTIQNIAVEIDGTRVDFQSETEDKLVFRTQEAAITVEKQPPKGLERERSGHPQLTDGQRFWVMDVQTVSTEDEVGFTATIPYKWEKDDPYRGFAALETEESRQHPIMPFNLQAHHPDIDSAKTEITIASQIFGHISGAARLLQIMPEELRHSTHIAAKNTDNVPKVVDHMRSMGIHRDDLMVPLTYDDGSSGGENIQKRKAAIWWIAQNPELVDSAILSKVVISDFREETAWLKHMADCMNLPQIFLASTYTWPQKLHQLPYLIPELRQALTDIPDTKTKIQAMNSVGLTSNDAVADWFQDSKRYKAAVSNNHDHAFAADTILSFSLVPPHEVTPVFDNCIIMPPRTPIETDNDTDKLWPKDKDRVVVVMGSGDWTEREKFVDRVTKSAKRLPNVHIIIVGPISNDDVLQNGGSLPANVNIQGYVPPATVDGLVRSCHVAMIKPGHFSLEESAGTLTLIAPPDNLEHAVSMAKDSGNPRQVAITVETDKERLNHALEEWFSLGGPPDFSPLLDISSPKTIAAKVSEALDRRQEFQPALSKIPRGGTQLLVEILKQLIATDFERGDVPAIVDGIKDEVESIWHRQT